MCNNFPNIRITEGNNFSIILPLRSRTYVATRPIDEEIDPEQLENLVVTFGGVQYPAQRTARGVQINLPATLAVGTYNILLTAEYLGSNIRAAYESAVTIVPWSEQSTAEQYITGSPIVLRAAYVLSGALTDAELEALKEEYREKNEQLAQAIADAEAAKREWEEKAAELDGVAQEDTLMQGVAYIRDDISHIDIDTTTLAKEATSQEIKTAIGTPAVGQPANLFAAIAAVASSGGGDAQERTSQAILAALNEIKRAHIIQSVSIDGYNFIEGTQVTAPGSIAFQSTSIISIYDEDVTVVNNYPMTSCKKIELPNLLEWRAGNSFRNNYNIVEILLPKVEVFTGDDNWAMNAQSLERFIIPQLRSLSALGLNASQTKLIDVSFGANASGNIGLSGWSPSVALNPSTSSLVKDGEPFANNLEKLLYNIREHIAAILPNRTGLSSRTIVFSAAVKAAILADQPTADAFTNKNWTIA